ncbi:MULTISPECIES: hypothetical protein [Streptomyces]|uniref:hypothetical protein n=1 Tax=Streptomyces TaxID=1883 RepID=UPI0022494028|nr:hypothetical protein [Streptomyces sp. JHD 1]MCX2970665.1 hypothetical protein [Streptomyces sp. JHD 1]
MPRKRNDDAAHWCGIVHNTLMHTNKELREALTAGLNDVREAGGSAQRSTREAVTAELGRLRGELWESRKELISGRGELGAEVHTALSGLQQELRRLREAFEHDRGPDGAPTDTSGHARPEGGAADAAGTADAGPVGTLPVGTALLGTVPAQRRATDGAVTGSPPDSAANGAQADSPPDSAANGAQADSPPDSAADGAQVETGAAGAQEGAGAAEEAGGPGGAEDGPHAERLAQAVVAALRQECGALQDELGVHLVGLQTDVATLSARWEEQLPPRPGQDAGLPGAPVATDEHRGLLRRAAGVSSALLVCHRDLWEFVIGQAGRHPHFRLPAQLADRGEGRIAADVSGRSLIGVLSSLFTAWHTAPEGDADWALASTVYDRIAAGLTALGPQGGPVTIFLDDRVPDSARDEDADESGAAPPSGRPEPHGPEPEAAGPEGPRTTGSPADAREPEDPPEAARD